MYSIVIRTAALFGLTGVLLGAFGAHALDEHLQNVGHLETWKTAVFYQVTHAIALLTLLGIKPLPSPALKHLTILWTLGILLFSGSLYGLSLQWGSWLGPITPIGGLLLIIGWLRLALARWSKPPTFSRPGTY